ncbi:MAG: division/cell wall cluster transcriptional repressor MraZ [Candidatus Wallbacteria bacterium]|nr:division/cell wall cluster transcriptional repressor MraZ [Candidatus Wallbacteria bacterium]
MISEFSGEYTHNIDQKGRLILPSRFREQLGDKFVVNYGLDSCLVIFSLDEWRKYLDKLSSLSDRKSENRQFLRVILSGKCEVETDSLGRFTIPLNLREKAGITKEVVIIGAGTKIEIWSKENWEPYFREAIENYEKNAEKIDFD